MRSRLVDVQRSTIATGVPERSRSLVPHQRRVCDETRGRASSWCSDRRGSLQGRQGLPKWQHAFRDRAALPAFAMQIGMQ